MQLRNRIGCLIFFSNRKQQKMRTARRVLAAPLLPPRSLAVLSPSSSFARHGARWETASLSAVLRRVSETIPRCPHGFYPSVVLIALSFPPCARKCYTTGKYEYDPSHRLHPVSKTEFTQQLEFVSHQKVFPVYRVMDESGEIKDDTHDPKVFILILRINSYVSLLLHLY